MAELENKTYKDTVERIKEEWRQLWVEHINDKVRAEGVAIREFPLCFVESGTIIMATRNFKPLDLKEILHLNRVQMTEQIFSPPPKVGGWRKFAHTVLNKQKRNRSFVLEKPRSNRVKNLQRKKGGRGWLHSIA